MLTKYKNYFINNPHTKINNQNNFPPAPVITNPNTFTTSDPKLTPDSSSFTVPTYSRKFNLISRTLRTNNIYYPLSFII